MFMDMGKQALSLLDFGKLTLELRHHISFKVSVAVASPMSKASRIEKEVAQIRSQITDRKVSPQAVSHQYVFGDQV